MMGAGTVLEMAAPGRGGAMAQLGIQSGAVSLGGSSLLGQRLLVARQKEVRKVQRVGQLRVMAAKIRRTKKAPMDEDYPWPDKYKPDERGGFLSFLSKFKDVPNKKKKPVTLPFERPMVELESKIAEVRELAKKTGMDFSGQVKELEQKYDQLKRDIYQRLTPIQRLSVARHPNRPTFLDHVVNITDKWVELHGDRGGYDDPALVCGIGLIEGMSFMLIGNQKGRNTKENIYRNFGMPTPNGYRKALRMMKHADHFGMPIITFIDTPGAYAGVTAEELGQGEAIAHNLKDMFSLKVPSISIVIGEGGSGGALAIGCCNKMLMLENAVYFVASPEACAAILWKSKTAAPKATEALKITGQELMKLNVVDSIIPEPMGGAHADPVQSSQNIKTAVMGYMRELVPMDPAEVMNQRLAKFRQIGSWIEGQKISRHRMRRMKPADRSSDQVVDSKGRPSLVPSPLQLLESKLFVSRDREANNTPVKASAGFRLPD